MIDNVLRIELKIVRHTGTDGKKFLTYSVLSKHGRWVDCKFRTSVTVPTVPGFMIVQKDNMSVDRNRKYQRVWIHAIDNFEPLPNGQINDYQPAKGLEDLF